MKKCSVLLTWAQSLDGRIATASGESRYISQSGSLELSQKLRSENDAILVGAGTVERDDPSLTCRIAPDRNPVRIVLDSRLRLSPDAQLVRTARQTTAVVYCLPEYLDSPAAVHLREAGVEIRAAAAGAEGRPALARVIDDLGARGIQSLMVEGGAQILTAFIREGLWDRILLVTAPVVLGRGVEAVQDLGIRSLSQAIRPRVEAVRNIGNEVVWDLRPQHEGTVAGSAS